MSKFIITCSRSTCWLTYKIIIIKYIIKYMQFIAWTESEILINWLFVTQSAGVVHGPGPCDHDV